MPPETPREALLQVPSPDCEIEVRSEQHAGNFHLHYRIRIPGEQPQSFPPVVLSQGPFAYFKSLFRGIEKLPRNNERARENAHATINGIGAKLADYFLPRDLSHRLWKLCKGGEEDRPPTLCVLSDETWIPWELLKLRNHKVTALPSPFLAEAFAFTRWLDDSPWRLSFPLKQIALVVPGDPRLDADQEERQVILDLADMERSVAPIPAKKLDLIDAMSKGRYDGWHFTGHGEVTGDNADLWVLRLEEDEILLAADLFDRASQLGRTQPLVFLNACHSGRAAFSLIGIGGWVSDFLKVGAGAFIGSHWALSDKPAAEFSALFYECFIRRGMLISEAAHRARLHIKNRFPGDPSWLAYTVFAHPMATCTTASDWPDSRSGRPSLVRREADVEAKPSQRSVEPPSESVAPPEATPPALEPPEEQPPPRLSTRWLGAAFLLLLLVAAAVFWQIRENAAVTPIPSNRSSLLAPDPELPPLVPLPRPSTAVLTFTNTSGNPDLDWLGTAFAEVLSAKLGMGGDLLVADRSEVAEAEIDLRLDHKRRGPELVDEDLSRLQTVLATDSIISGSFRSIGESSLIVDLVVYDTISRTALLRRQGSGESNNWFELADRISADEPTRPSLRERLSVPPLTLKQRAQLWAWYRLSPRTARLYAEGLSRARHYQISEAIGLLRQAAEGEPHPLIFQALAKALEYSGLDTEASAAIRQSIDLASTLTDGKGPLLTQNQEELTRLQNRILGNWQEFVSQSRSLLYQWFPDDLLRGVRYVEELASAAYSSGVPFYFQKARRELRRLHELHEATASPYIFNLAEAHILLLEQEYEAAEATAREAAIEANQLGLARTHAVAQLIQARALLTMDRSKEAEGNQLRQQAHAALREIGDLEKVAISLEEAATLYESFDLGQAERFFREAVQAYEAAGYRLGKANALLRLSVVLSFQGRQSAAEEVAAEAQRLFGNENGAQNGYLALQDGIWLQLAGRLREAQSRYDTAKVIFDRFNLGQAYAIALTNLGEIDYLCGKFREADEFHRAALEIHEGPEATGSTSGEEEPTAESWADAAYDNYRIGKVAAAWKDYTTAQHFYELALPAYDLNTAEEVATAGEIILARAELDLFRGAFTDAEQRLREALKPVESAEEVALEARMQAALAMALLPQPGKMSEAKDAATQALELVKDDGERTAAGDFRAVWEAQIAASYVGAATGEAEEALQSLDRIRTQAAESGIVIYEFEAILAMGKIEIDLGRTHQGRPRLEALRERAKEVEFTQIENRVADVLGRTSAELTLGPRDRAWSMRTRFVLSR